MKFKSLELLNWRSFCGIHKINISCDPSKPITLIIGPNGSGKTSILNAFTWVLYGEFTEGFENTQKLINLDSLEKDETAQAYVKLVFEHEGSIYKIKRTTDAIQQRTNHNSIDISKDDSPAFIEDINRLLPLALKDMFFFPAESFSTAKVLKGEDPGDGTTFDVGKAIRSLLSGDLYDHASDDIFEATNSSTLKLSKNITDKHITKKFEEYEEKRKQLRTCEERQKELPALLVKARKDLANSQEVAKKYNIEEFNKWNVDYELCQKELENISTTKGSLNNLYVELSYIASEYFTNTAISNTITRLTMAEKIGLIPPRIDKKVLEKSLEESRCLLCMRELNHDSIEHIKHVHDKVGDTTTAVNALEVRTNFSRSLNQFQTKLNTIFQEVNSIAQTLKLEKLGKVDILLIIEAFRKCVDVLSRKEQQVIADKEKLLKSKNDNVLEFDPFGMVITNQRLVDQLEGEMRALPIEKELLEQNKNTAFNEYQKVIEKNEQYSKKNKAITLLNEAKDYFDFAIKGLEEYGRIDFEKAVNQTYSEMISKSYNVKVDADFSIIVEHAKKGTDTLISIRKGAFADFFLGAIARLAPIYEQIARNRKQFDEAGVVLTASESGFPVVLDSPTSPLDNKYEIDVIKVLPKLLPQVIIPISAKSLEKWETVDNSIGHVYIIELTSDKAENDSINWRGRDYVYSNNDMSYDLARATITNLK